METKNETKHLRNTNIEMLRFFLMVFICLWHVIVHGIGFKYIGFSDDFIPLNLFEITFFCSFFSPAVYTFMYISGWYGMVFSVKKLTYLIYLGFCCSIISNIIKYLWIGKSITIGVIPTQLFPISCNKWWFFSYYIIIYLISPLINKGIEQIEKKQFRLMIILMTFIEVISLLQFVPKSGSTLYGLLYIYILARYIKIEKISFNSYKLIFLYLSSLLLLWAMCYLSCKLPGNKASLAFLVLGYNNPFIIIMAISIFMLIEKLKPTNIMVLNTFLSPVLAIYLLTEGVGLILYSFMANLFKYNIIYGGIFIFAVIFLCIFIGHFLTSTFNILIKSRLFLAVRKSLLRTFYYH